MASIDCAYQIEGGYYADGKGQSIWDVLSDTKGKTYLGQNGKIARDFYHRYAQDIAIMSQLKIPNFRFSLSWSRLVPAGIGAVNPTGRKGLNNFLPLLIMLPCARQREAGL